MQSKENNFAHVHDSSKERTERKKIKKEIPSAVLYPNKSSRTERKKKKIKTNKKECCLIYRNRTILLNGEIHREKKNKIKTIDRPVSLTFLISIHKPFVAHTN